MAEQLTRIAATQDWRLQLRDVITRPTELLSILGLTPEQVALSEGACDSFPLKVPRSFVARMRARDPQDPLLLQVLSTQHELRNPAGFSVDPVGEHTQAIPRAGIIHKYRGRVLLIVTGGCAVNCRYCFRRHFPYGDNQNSRSEWRAALDYIRADNSISEVILSGGDPLVAGDEQLAELVGMIGDISQVQRLRIHSRLPIVIPERVTGTLLDAISHPRLSSVMVLHSNHANELDGAVGDAVAAMRSRGMTVLNQAVLLAGVNDTVDAQHALSERLFALGVLPYYLHLLDRVAGAAHFDVAEAAAVQLHAALSARLPGYLVPRLVREVAGANAKVGILARG
ncbi:MAG: EF-P beta-lysylation protein EpmB [Halioglobus sp.]